MSRPCPYCGNNQVPHWLNWYQESLNILFEPIRRRLLNNPLSRRLKQSLFGQKAAAAFISIGSFLGLVRLRRDRAKCRIRRAQVLWEEAGRRGIEMSEVLLFGRPIDVYVAEKKQPSFLIVNPLPLKIKDKGLRIIFSGLPRPLGQSSQWLERMDDKYLLKQKLSAAGLPVAAGGSAATMAGAIKFFSNLQKPVIVKPRAGSRGRHTTTHIYNEADLCKAVKVAKQLCYWVIVEEQLSGPVYRATVINGQLAGVLRGDPPQVTGDGRQSIAELIADQNRAPRPGVKNIAPDEAMEIFLMRQNLRFASVPEAGLDIKLSEKIGVNYGGSSSEDYEICHPDNKELFIRAAEVLGDPIVGFDFIISDITKSFKEQKCGFIEANSLPFINLHHDPLRGSARNAAALVWDMMGW